MQDHDLSSLVSPATFIATHPNLGTVNTVRWQLRHRHHNGLVEAGAVLELRQRPDQRRPQLLIHVQRYAGWLHEQHKYLAAMLGSRPSDASQMKSGMRHARAATRKRRVRPEGTEAEVAAPAPVEKPAMNLRRRHEQG